MSFEFINDINIAILKHDRIVEEFITATENESHIQYIRDNIQRISNEVTRMNNALSRIKTSNINIEVVRAANPAVAMLIEDLTTKPLTAFASLTQEIDRTHGANQTINVTDAEIIAAAKEKKIGKHIRIPRGVTSTEEILKGALVEPGTIILIGSSLLFLVAAIVAFVAFSR